MKTNLWKIKEKVDRNRLKVVLFTAAFSNWSKDFTCSKDSWQNIYTDILKPFLYDSIINSGKNTVSREAILQHG